MTEYLSALPDNYPLGKYRIVKYLGSGGFGITYLAHDTVLGRKVAIKEYMPSDFAVRSDRTTVQPKSAASKNDFNWGAGAFIDEARTLTRFEHPNIVQVHDLFQANNTAYIVMKYVEGNTLENIFSERILPEAEVIAILTRLGDGLKDIHAEGFLHRDIKPANIMIRAGGDPVLIDFGAARQIVGSRSRPVTTLLTPGYAPLEQYSTGAANLGPWSDIYALGAVAYHALSGKIPPDAVNRVRNDPLVPLAEAARTPVGAALTGAIDRALSVFEENRPQSVETWLAALTDPEPAPERGEDRHAGVVIDAALARGGGEVEVNPGGWRGRVKIAPGTANQSKLRIAGAGGPGRHGGADGDLMVTVSVQGGEPKLNPVLPSWAWKRVTGWLVLGLLVLGIGTGVWKGLQGKKPDRARRADDAAYNRAHGLDQEEAYRGYLQNCEPVCAHRQTALSALERLANQAELARRDRRLRDDEAFLFAKRENIVAAFESYLAGCAAECGHADEALGLIQELDRANIDLISKMLQLSRDTGGDRRYPVHRDAFLVAFLGIWVPAIPAGTTFFWLAEASC